MTHISELSWWNHWQLSVDKNGNCNLPPYVMTPEKKRNSIKYGRLSGSSYSCEKWVLYWLIDIVYLHPNFLHLRVLKEFERLLVYLSHKSDQPMSKVSFLVGLDIQWTGYRKIPDDKFLLVLEFLTDCVLLHKLNRPIERFFLRSNTICNVQWNAAVFKVAETILWFILKKASDLHGNYIN